MRQLTERVLSPPPAGRGAPPILESGLTISPQPVREVWTGVGAKPYLSVVIPAYNEAGRLPGTLDAVAAWVAGRPEHVEVLVVENGSTDSTASIAREFAEHHAYASAVSGLPRGKGVAVREGMLAAQGSLRFLCDADLSMPIGDVVKFLPAIESGAQVVIGSREAPGARRFGEPPHRHLMGRVFNLIVKTLAVPGIEDTQCGFKMFTAEAAEAVFGRARLTGWGFDPEVLYIARKLGFDVVEVPIDWHYSADSRVRPVADSVLMVRDLLMIRWNDLKGRYGA